MNRIATVVLAIALFAGGGVRAAEVINAGVGGNSAANLLKRVEKDVIARNPSAVVIMVGTNDWLNSAKFTTAQAYQKNVTELVRKIKAGGSRVILITPPPCIPELLFTRHDPVKYGDLSPNDRIEKARKILLEIGKSESIPVVDLNQHLIKNKLAEYNESSVLRNPKNKGGKDGVHFNAAGYKIMADLVAEKIQSGKVDTSKVICFGDSITFGAGMKGAGTSDGETYPAFLKAALAEKP